MHLVALLAAAGAHVPHDNLLGLAVPDALSEGVPWFAVGNPVTPDIFLRSQDGGLTWQMVGGDPTRDSARDLARLDDGTLVLLGAQWLWWSSDGSSWDREPAPPGARLVVATDRLWIVTGDGLFEGQPGKSPTQHLAGSSIVTVSDGPGGTLALDDGGTAHLYDGKAWSELGAVGDGPTSALSTDDALYVGDQAGTVWRHEGDSWQACGALPDPDDKTFEDIIALAGGNGVLLAATGFAAPFVSTDGCASWEDRRAPLELFYDLPGWPSTPDESITEMLVAGDRFVVAGWDGVARSDDAGQSWTLSHVIPPDYTRGLALSPTFFEDGTAYVGGYAAGVLRTFDGGASFDAPSHGLDDPNVQKVYIPPWADDPDEIYAIVGHRIQRSADGGESWQPVPDPMGFVSHLVFLDAPGSFLAFGPGAGDGPVVETVDGGKTWIAHPALKAALGPAGPLGSARWSPADNEQWCVSTYSPARVLCSEDGGDTWIATDIDDSSTATDMLAWPPGDPEHLVTAFSSGVAVSEDGNSWTLSSPTADDPPKLLTMADDGTLFLATFTSAIWRSDDGGASWTDLGVQPGAGIHVLEAHPDLPQHDTLVVGTHGGTFVVEDALTAPSLRRWAKRQRVDATSEFLFCWDAAEPCPALVYDESASMDARLELRPGGGVSVWLRGSTLMVSHQSDGASEAEVRVDGALVATLGSEVGPRIHRIEDLTEGMHLLEIDGIDGTGFSIDWVEGISDSAPLPFEPGSGPGDSADTGGSGVPATDDTGAATPTHSKKRCGCASSADHPGLVGLVALLFAARRRKRTDGGPAWSPSESACQP